jgi:hypothetical protein
MRNALIHGPLNVTSGVRMPALGSARCVKGVSETVHLSISDLQSLLLFNKFKEYITCK